jgi:hypothetical protein
MKYLFVLAILPYLLSGCAGKRNMSSELTDYEKTLQLAAKLKEKPASNKTARKLAAAYQDASAWFAAEIEAEKKSGNATRWNNIVVHMSSINQMADEIEPIAGISGHISNIVRYRAELDSAKLEAADECIAIAKPLINPESGRMSLRTAMVFLRRAKMLNPDIQGVDENIELIKQYMGNKTPSPPQE